MPIPLHTDFMSTRFIAWERLESLTRTVDLLAKHYYCDRQEAHDKVHLHSTPYRKTCTCIAGLQKEAAGCREFHALSCHGSWLCNSPCWRERCGCSGGDAIHAQRGAAAVHRHWRRLFRRNLQRINGKGDVCSCSLLHVGCKRDVLRVCSTRSCVRHRVRGCRHVLVRMLASRRNHPRKRTCHQAPSQADDATGVDVGRA